MNDSALSWRRVLHQLREPAVRDLGFVLLSPSLLQPGHVAWGEAVAVWDDEEWSAWRRWLFTQDLAPQRLAAHLAEAPAQRLGRYAEQLLSYALANAPPEIKLHLLSSRQVLSRAGQTTGELDFVLERHGVVEHWELAVKFYCQEGPATLDSFASPEGHDTLADKIEHLFERQLPRQPAPQFPQADRARAYLRGWLFYPARAPSAGRFEALGLNPQHPGGTWLLEHEVGLLKQASWVPLPRLAWLPPASIGRDTAGNYPALHLPPPGRTSLWAQVAKRTSGLREEVQRVMVCAGARAVTRVDRREP